MIIKAYIFEKESNKKRLVFETIVDDEDLRVDVRDAFYSLLDLTDDDYYTVTTKASGDHEDIYKFYFKVDSLGNTTVADRTAQVYADLYSEWLEKQHAERQAIENALKEWQSEDDADAVDNDDPFNKAYRFDYQNDTVEEVNHPDRYNKNGMEVIQIMKAFMGKEAVMDFDICNVIKYVLRFKEKNGIEDLKKARWYLNNYISLYDDAESEQ